MTTKNYERISRRHTRMIGSRRVNRITNANEDNVGPTNASSMPTTKTNPRAFMASSKHMSSSAQETIVIPT